MLDAPKLDLSSKPQLKMLVEASSHNIETINSLIIVLSIDIHTHTVFLAGMGKPRLADIEASV